MVDSKEDDVTGEGSQAPEPAVVAAAHASEPAEEPGPEPAKKKKRKRRRSNSDAAEQRLRGRRELCPSIADIAEQMLKTVKLRILGQYLESTKGLSEADLTNKLKADAKKIASPKRLQGMLDSLDPDVNRRNLKRIVLIGVLLQEELHSLEESKLEAKVIEFEKRIVQAGKDLDFFDRKKHDPIRWHQFETYRVALDAAWKHQDDVSPEEANLLRVLRGHLNISALEHWTIGAHLGRFPKKKNALHTPEEIHDARKQLQRESLLWSYRDQRNQNIDVIPADVVPFLRESVNLELQFVNYRRLMQNDALKLPDLREALSSRDMDRYGNKPELVDRIVSSDASPTAVLSDLDRTKLSEMCRMVGLPLAGSKKELIARLIAFYDDLTFEERVTQDPREEWYNNFALLAARRYSDLRAKKLISKDLDIEHQFERATEFLFEVMLGVEIDVKRKVTKADGRIALPQNQVIAWDCKSAEGPVNLQDYLDSQFDAYLRKEQEKGFQPLAFLVIGPTFTKESMLLAQKYKARTNWDIALVTAEGLKHLADRWGEQDGESGFPIRLLNRTEIIDKEKAEFLLSLA